MRRLREGRVIPFLGAGTNLCGRPKDASWRAGEYLPSGTELAAYLADGYGYPASETLDLLRVSQYVQAMTGGRVLYDELHGLFDRDYPATVLHTMLASLPRMFRAEGNGSRHQLIVTTNYDDALERAFAEADEEYDLVCYMARGEHRGSSRTTRRTARSA
jgi:ATP phosphoribosyltransferase regulatory subunit HisZ